MFGRYISPTINKFLRGKYIIQMSVDTSANGHIEVITTDFNEFSNGSFRIKKTGTDQKTAELAIIYDTPAVSPIVEIKQDGVIKDSSELISLVNNEEIFTIFPQINQGSDHATCDSYSFDVVVMSNELRHPIIDSITMTGRIIEAFVEPMTVNMTLGDNNSYNFTFELADGDGPLDKIAGYKILSIDNGINLLNADNDNQLSVGDVVQNIKATRTNLFNGRIIFTIALVDTNGFERKSQCAVVKYDTRVVVPPRLTTTGFNPQLNKNNILAIYEAAPGNILTVGTIRFILDDSMYDDGNFELSWQLIQGTNIVKINNDSEVFASSMQISNNVNSPALLTFNSYENKFGALMLMYELKYSGEVLSGTRQIIELDIIPSSDVSLVAKNKRLYMMNRHKINLNDVSVDGYNGTQSFSGKFNWFAPDSSNPIDKYKDGSAIASLIASKGNFNRSIIANITKYDEYDGRTYDFLDQTIFLNISKIRLSIAYTNGKSFKFKTTQENIDALEASMVEDNYDSSQISTQLGYWVACDNLESTDIIFDPTSGFYGKINLSYQCSDTLGNSSNTATVSLLICPYSNIRVVSIDGDGESMLLDDVQIPLTVTFENSYSNDNYDFLSQESIPEVRAYLAKLSKADIDFTRTTITTFQYENLDVGVNGVLEFSSIVDNLDNHYTTKTAINKIYWGQQVKYNQIFAPNAPGAFNINFKVLANMKSIAGNSQYVFAKDSSSTIEIKVFNNIIDRFKEINAESITANSLTIIDSSENPQNLFVVNESGVNCALPMVIENNENGNSLVVNGTATIDVISAGNADLGNLTVTDSITATHINSTYVDVSGDVSILGSLYSEGLASFTAGLDVTDMLNADNVDVGMNLIVDGSTSLNDTTIESLVVNYDSEFLGGLTVCNGKVIFSESDGITSNVPVTIGSGTSDIMLTVNGSVATYGDLTINDTDIVFQDGKLDIAVNTNIGNEENNADLNVTGTVGAMQLNVSGDSIISGNLSAGAITLNSDMTITNNQEGYIYPSYAFIKQITGDGDLDLCSPDNNSYMFVMFTNNDPDEGRTFNVRLTTYNGLELTSIAVTPGMSLMLRRDGTEIYQSQYYPQWAEMGRSTRLLPN